MFGCMLLACAIIPTLSTDLPFAPAADTIALVGVFGLARIFISLAAMDVGTSFGTLGGRREMLVGFLAEPALLMVIFTTGDDRPVDLAGHHRRDPGPPRLHHLSQPGLRRHRLHLRLLGRERPRAGGQPGHPPRADHDPRGDDPRILGAPPGADRVGGQPQAVRLFLPRPGAVLPLGHRRGRQLCRAAAAIPLLLVKLAIGGFLLAGIETVNAKVRIFRAPEFLGTAFLLAVLGLLVRLLLEVPV
jgi:hypothetical protein